MMTFTCRSTFLYVYNDYAESKEDVPSNWGREQGVGYTIQKSSMKLSVMDWVCVSWWRGKGWGMLRRECNCISARVDDVIKCPRPLCPRAKSHICSVYRTMRPLDDASLERCVPDRWARSHGPHPGTCRDIKIDVPLKRVERTLYCPLGTATAA